MEEFLKPVVVLERISVDHVHSGVTPDSELLNYSNNFHLLHVNGILKKRNTILENTDDHPEEPLTKNAELESPPMTDKIFEEKGSDLTEKEIVNPSLKNVSFSNQSSILYYSEEQVISELSDLEVSYISHSQDSPEHTDKSTDIPKLTCSVPTVESFQYLSSDVEVKCPEHVSDIEQGLLHKELVVTLERLPVSILKGINNENYIPSECFNGSETLIEKNIDIYLNSQQDKSQERKLTECAETMLGDQALEINVPATNAVSTDLLLDGNACVLPELKVSLQRLPDDLLELHLNNNAQNSERIINSESHNSGSKAVCYENRLERTGLNTSTIETMTQNSAKESKFRDHGLLTDRKKSTNHDSCDMFIKSPVVQLERLNLVVEDNQQAKGPQVRKLIEKNLSFGGQDDINDNAVQKINLPLKDSSKKPHRVLNSMPSTSKRKIKLESCHSNGLLDFKEKCKSSPSHRANASHKKPRCKSSLSHQAKTSNEKVKLKSCLQKENEISVIEDRYDLSDVGKILSAHPQNLKSSSNAEIHSNLSLPEKKRVSQISSGIDDVPSSQLTNPSCCTSRDLVGLESYHDMNNMCSPEVDEQARLSCMSNRKVSETSIPIGNLGCVLDRSTSEDNMPLSPFSQNCDLGCMSDSSSSEDDMPLSQFSKLNYTKQPKVPASLKKKGKKKSRKNNSITVCQTKFNDFNVLHFAGMSQPDLLPLTPKSKKKSKKISSQTSGINKHSNKKLILYSHLPNMSKPDSLTLLAKVKKNPKKSFSPEKCRNSRAKKCIPNEDIILLPHLSKINCIDTSILASKQMQVPSCENTSASNLQSVRADHCYYGSLVANTTHKKSISLLKKVKLDHSYGIPCNWCRVKQNKTFANHSKNNISSDAASANSKAKTPPKGKRRKKKGDVSRAKKEKIPSNPDVFLKTYLQKFCSDFDELGNDGRENENTCSASVFSGQKKKPDKESARKKKEKAYKLIISKLHDHVKETCSVKKTYKRLKKQKAKLTDVNVRGKVQLPLVKTEPGVDSEVLPSQSGTEELNVSEKSRQPFSSEMNFTRRKRLKNRKRHKECLRDKYILGLLTGNRSRRLYNKCLASERLLLSKYKMKTRQRKKLKKIFNSLKNNSQIINEL